MKEKKLKAHLDELGLRKKEMRRENPLCQTLEKKMVCRESLGDGETFLWIKTKRKSVEGGMLERGAGRGNLLSPGSV